MRMASSNSPDPLSPARDGSIRDGGIRKKMRKGTHSCFECRRRKIRCIFSPSNPNICSECFARGSKCIDQEHADPNIIVDQRKNLRERVARLEGLVDTLLDELNDRKSAQHLQDLGPDAPIPVVEQPDDRPQLPHHERAPLLSLLDNSVWTAANDETSESGKKDVSNQALCREDTNGARDGFLDSFSKSSKEKTERVCQILKNALPDQEKLLHVLNSYSTLWTNLTTLMVGSGTPKELTSIHAFAAYAMGPKGTPMDLAKILQFVAGKSSDDEIERLLSLIERLVLHDDEYMGTLSGVEVALQQVRLHSDIGQARRAWLTTRRAMNFAQLMGLHRTRVNVRQDILWWGLFQHDRFTSLTLGTPYAVPDIHCNLTFKGKDIPKLMTIHGFMTRLAMFAGRVIDRTHGVQESSFSSLLAIDNDLTRFGNQMPPEFWTLEPQASEENHMEWLQKGMAQVLYHQTRLILHIPYMLKSVTDNGFDYSRDTCFESARSIITVFLIMRDEVNSWVLKARFLDFVSFMALVTLVIGLVSANKSKSSGSTPGVNHSPSANQKQQAEDWKRIDSCIETYGRISDQPFGKVARQSYRALQQLTKFRNGPVEGEDNTVKVVVPFFGTITLKFQSQDPVPDEIPQQQPHMTHPTVNNVSSPAPHGMTPPIATSHLASPISPTSSTPTMPLPNGPMPGMHNMPPFQHPYTPAPPNASLHTPGVSSGFEPHIAYDGVYMQPSPYNAAAYINSGSAGMSCVIPSAHLPPNYGWQNVGTFDIDQDWNWETGASPTGKPGHRMVDSSTRREYTG